MIKLRKLLSDSRKIRRRRRIFLSMNITIASWLTEFFGNIAWGLMAYYPQENGTTRGLQYLVFFMYFIVIPSSYLLNTSDIRKTIVDSRNYLAFTNRFFPHINQIQPVNNDQNEELDNNGN